MSAANGSHSEPDAAPEGASVLANLPRTRPQRTSPRRAAARAAAGGSGEPATPAERTNGGANGHTNGREGTGAKGTEPAGAPRTGAKGTEPAGAPRTGAGTRAGAAKRTSKARGASGSPRARTTSAPAEPAPRQGFDGEGERTRGTVHPPGGAELVASAVEIVGELAKTGLSTGERLLKDALSRLPLS
jgi:hypothetical protein